MQTVSSERLAAAKILYHIGEAARLACKLYINGKLDRSGDALFNNLFNMLEAQYLTLKRYFPGIEEDKKD